MAVVVLAGCGWVQFVDGKLVGGDWQAVSIGGAAPVVDSAPTLAWNAEGLHGNAGCNGYTSQRSVVIEGNSIDIGDILQTLGQCLVTPAGPETPGQAQERRYMAILNEVDRIAFRGDQLVLSGPTGELVFERAP